MERVRRVTSLGSPTRGKGRIWCCIDKSVLKWPYLTMQCERSGIYKPPKTRKKLNLEGISSRKCNCLFRLKGFFDKDTNDWWLAMLCGMHNHDLEEKLSAEEKKKVIEMTKSLTVPQNILTNLKQNNKESVTTIKQVYNVRTRWHTGERDDMTELQFLISKLVEHIYVYYTRCNSEETTLEDIFFAHPESVKLLNTFPTVLVMDSTYKTNNHRMPLFEIVGCTSTKMTYSVGFTFLHFELEDNFAWELTILKGLRLGEDKEEDFWKTVYYPQLLKDDSEVDFMFRVMVENNNLYLFVRSVEVIESYLSSGVIIPNSSRDNVGLTVDVGEALELFHDTTGVMCMRDDEDWIGLARTMWIPPTCNVVREALGALSCYY
ncbi:hypothetical protein MTR_7g065910 [Medicago truncatula]|uniref:MULE transposase domain-containing protein n=1 Tax=Medicago truncatula TaxID=3880 RepID=A0A072U0A7_MEDTR|nr:hypothetical protein MTR_7g065910 [Medicago truncatula]